MEQFVPTVPPIETIERPPMSQKNSKSRKYRNTTVVCNHYDIKFKNDAMEIIQWDLKFEPEIPKDARNLIDDLMGAKIGELRKRLGPFIRTGHTLFSFDPKVSDIVTMLHEDKKAQSDTKIILTKINKKLNLSMLLSKGIESVQIIRVLNSHIKNQLHALKYEPFGLDKKYYDKDTFERVTLQDFILNIKQGFMATIDIYQNNQPKIMIDNCSRIIRGYNLWEEYLFFTGDKGIKHDEVLEEYILGKSFLADYGNQRIYRVEEIDDSKTPLSKFPNDEFKNYAEYFLKRYGYKIEYPDQFLVIAKRRKKVIQPGGKKIEVVEDIHLIPEMLKPTGLTDEMRRDFRIMRDVANYTQLTPEQRVKKTNAIINQLNTVSKKNKQEMGLEITQGTNTVRALEYKYPRVEMQGNVNNSKGNFFIKEPILNPVSIKKWIIFCDSRDKNITLDMAKNMKKASQSLNITLGKPSIIPVKYGKGMDRELIEYMVANKNDCQIFCFFFQKRTADRIYKKVKDEANNKLGVVTQFFANWNPKNKKSISNLSVFSKILIQMVVKLGGVPWKVQKPYNLNNNGKDTMVIGCDIWKSFGKNSIVSVVGTYDRDLMKYYSTSRAQEPAKAKGDYIMQQVAEQVKECANHYNAVNKRPPNYIIMYRDGVGKGQLNEVREKEVALILKHLKELFGENKTPKLAYMVLTKRINDRFFSQSKGKVMNPNGALIVEEQVVNNEGFDFYMVAQSVFRGTATPTHYEFLYNDTDLNADSFYELTYYQCFNYYNWSGPIKIPAVVMYASKQAYLLGETQPRRRDKQKKRSRSNSTEKEKLKKAPYYL